MLQMKKTDPEKVLLCVWPVIHNGRVVLVLKFQSVGRICGKVRHALLSATLSLLILPLSGAKAGHFLNSTHGGFNTK